MAYPALPYFFDISENEKFFENNLFNIKVSFDFLYKFYVKRASCQEQLSEIKVKVKVSCYGPGVAQMVGRGVAVLFHDLGTIRG